MQVIDCDVPHNPQPPNLANFPVGEAERKVAERYTRIKPVAVEGVPDAHTVWLVVGNQLFQVGDYYDTPEQASWMCWQLAKGLVRFREESA